MSREPGPAWAGPTSTGELKDWRLARRGADVLALAALRLVGPARQGRADEPACEVADPTLHPVQAG